MRENQRERDKPLGGPRCQQCGTQQDLLADAGVVLCPPCFDEQFPDLERPPALEATDD